MLEKYGLPPQMGVVSSGTAEADQAPNSNITQHDFERWKYFAMSVDFTTEKPGDTASKTRSILGPFLGFVTERSIKIWLHLEGGDAQVFVSVHRENEPPPTEPSGVLRFTKDQLWTACTTIENLQPGTEYVYGLWRNAACSIPLPLDGLSPSELRFKTISAEPDAQIDFLMMSCHNPFVATEDGYEGHGVWADIPQIIGQDSNKNVRFALLVGDQVYADDWKAQLLAAPDHARRLSLYLDVYRKYWKHIFYRRVLCSLPAMMMWDDHDIMDGWGSTADSLNPRQAPRYWRTIRTLLGLLPKHLASCRQAGMLRRFLKTLVTDMSAVSRLAIGALSFWTCEQTAICV